MNETSRLGNSGSRFPKIANDNSFRHYLLTPLFNGEMSSFQHTIIIKKHGYLCNMVFISTSTDS